MELKIMPYKEPEQITFNYEELKAELIAKATFYETIIYTEDQIVSAKKDRANLNRLKKALNDERLRREKEYMQSFNVFKAQINEIISIIDKPTAVIDKQVKEFEEKQKAEKHQAIELYFDECQRPEWLQLEQIFDPKWLNASVKLAAVCEEINTKIADITNALEILAEMPEFGFEATEEYKRTLDVNSAISEGKRLAEIQRRKKAAVAADNARTAKFSNAPDFSEQKPKEAAYCLSFRAWLNLEQAQVLKRFFLENNIKFEQI